VLAVVVPIRSLIWRAMVRKACSTLVALFAEVSRNGMPRLSANSCCLCQMVELDVRAAGTYLCYSVLNQQLVDALSSVTVDLLQPLLYVVERVHVSNIVDNADTMGAPVVRRCDGSEPLLAGGVPL
jgi:hypothetical protein